MEKLILKEWRSGYGADQVEDYTIKVADLRQILEMYDDDDVVILKLNGRGATYVGIEECPYDEDAE